MKGTEWYEPQNLGLGVALSRLQIMCRRANSVITFCGGPHRKYWPVDDGSPACYKYKLHLDFQLQNLGTLFTMMVVASIIEFTASAPTDTTIEQLTHILSALDEPTQYVVGVKIQDPTTIQISSEWHISQSATDTSTSSDFQSFIKAVSNLAALPVSVTLVSLDKSPFANGTPPLLEYVKNDFPAESVTPEFQKQIEMDFARFEAIFRRRGTAEETGEVGLSIGWTAEQNHVRSFLVMRGWKSMDRFEAAVQSDVFKECIHILIGWGAPFKLVSNRVKRRGRWNMLMLYSGMLSGG